MTTLQLQPTLAELSFQGSDSTTYFVNIITNLLSKSECQTLISSHKDLIPSNVTPQTIRTREQFDDYELSDLLWERLKYFYGKHRVKDEERYWWKAARLNERFRLCRYEKGRLDQSTKSWERGTNYPPLTPLRRQILAPLRWKTNGRSKQPILHDRQYVPQYCT